MGKTMFSELKYLEKLLLRLSAMVEENIDNAVNAFRDRDVELAKMVIDSDREIDRLEVCIEEECLKTLALYQPVANDLRFIVGSLKINNDLERVGDLANNIAKSTLAIATAPPVEISEIVVSMAEKVLALLHGVINAFVNFDTAKAEETLLKDREIDQMNARIFERVSHMFQGDPILDSELLHYVIVSRNLERVGDHATNIAEDIIYMFNGEIVRHAEKLKTFNEKNTPLK